MARIHTDSTDLHGSIPQGDYWSALRAWVATSLLVGLAGAQSLAARTPIVGLDCFHNNEPAPHYFWHEQDAGGYSEFAGVVKGLGADTLSIHGAADSQVLSRCDIYVIVDPDTTTEAPNPQYISAVEIDAIDKWVQRGGVLMLLANNARNCEFTHLNELGSRFGIHFNADTYSGGYDLAPLPTHPFFTQCDTLFIKDICTFTLAAPATAVLTLNGRVLMATATRGVGAILALGDPWLYNEYISSQDNRRCGTNVMRWLISRIPMTTALAAPCPRRTAPARMRGRGHGFAVNGRTAPARAAPRSTAQHGMPGPNGR